jgi:hypothetical protein
VPIDRHLEVTEIRDFSPGLYESSDWLLPAGAAQEMLDCYPQPGGGLRAFFKEPSGDLGSGSPLDPENDLVIGVFSRGNIASGTSLPVVGSGTTRYTVDRYLAVVHKTVPELGLTNYTPKMYRRHETGIYNWEQVYVTSGTTEFDSNMTTGFVNSYSVEQSIFRYYKASSGNEYVIVTMRYNGDTPGGPGIYRMKFSDDPMFLTELTTSVTGATRPNGVLVVHQGRVVVAGLEDRDGIIWSNVGGTTFSAENYLQLQPSEESGAVVAMVAIEPGDLLVFREAAPILNVQGDITDPVVLELAAGVIPGNVRQEPCKTPYGVTFIAEDGGVYVTNGTSIEPLSQQISGFGGEGGGGFSGVGTTNFLNDFLFCPGGYVYDFRTKSWFTQSVLTARLHDVESTSQTVWGPNAEGYDWELKELRPFDGERRAATFSWKSAPLRSPYGRQLVMREVEVVAKSYDDDATVAVTVNGTTVTRDMGTAGIKSLRFYFNERAEVLDVRLVSTAGTDPVSGTHIEGPSIEALRFKTLPGHHQR